MGRARACHTPGGDWGQQPASVTTMLCRGAYGVLKLLPARAFSLMASSNQCAPIVAQRLIRMSAQRECSTAAMPAEELETVGTNEQSGDSPKSIIVKAKQVRHSPKKLMLLCRQLAGLNLTEAYAQMSFSEKRVAKTRLRQLVSSAWYVAQEHHNLDPRELVIKEAWVGKQEFLKRIRYHAKGRAGKARRPICQISLRLEPEAPHYVGTRKNIEKHGKFEGMIRTHWKRWKKLKKPEHTASVESTQTPD